MATTPTRAVNLTRQLIAITAVVAGADGRVHCGVLRCVLRLQPSPASQIYTVNLTYQHGRRPRVSVTDPPLTLHPGAAALPHVYLGDELCLSYPGEWTHELLLARTVVPWISEWLIHYEIWLITGRWAGGGHSYTIRADRRAVTTCMPPRHAASELDLCEAIRASANPGAGPARSRTCDGNRETGASDARA